ncbi:DUF2293 domain-containing protein [Mycobacterium sp. WMMD1722]|uniref:DUF2293 domain-containing protein n=1 Tax=Mycobacterium sp. WMMD1722 TaxID=3404117 RepID=UPI003BF46E28
MARLETRVARVAEAALADRQFVTPIDVLIGLGWLTQAHVDRWLDGRVAALGLCISVDADKTAAALVALSAWAQDRGLRAWDTDYGDRTFTTDGDTDAERIFRTRWAGSEQPAPALPRRHARGLTVEAAEYAWTCNSCGGEGDLLLKTRTGVVCLDCADLGHLVFLPSGDAALTRRATKGSRLSAVVVQWRRRRNRYEQQGILAEADAIEAAARQCLADADARALRRQRDAQRREVIDEKFRGDFAEAIREHFPGCPPARADAIAYHAALRGSGRIGRSAAGRALNPDSIRLAVAASVRHVDTNYDDLLMAGVDRDDARHRVHERVERILAAWRDGVNALDG